MQSDTAPKNRLCGILRIAAHVGKVAARL